MCGGLESCAELIVTYCASLSFQLRVTVMFSKEGKRDDLFITFITFREK